MPAFPIEVLLALRFLKLVAVLALAAGTLGAFVPRALEDRRRLAYRVAGPGFGGTLFLGLVLAWGGGVSFLAPWIVGAVLLSIASINVVLWSVGKDGRRSRTAASLAIATLLGALALMVWKPA